MFESVFAFLMQRDASAERVPGTSALVSKVEKWGKLFAAEMKSG